MLGGPFIYIKNVYKGKIVLIITLALPAPQNPAIFSGLSSLQYEFRIQKTLIYVQVDTVNSHIHPYIHIYIYT